MVLDALSFVIQRRIPQPLSAVHGGLADRGPLAPTRLLTLDPDGFLHIVEPFRPVTPFSWRQPTPSWCAQARLMTNRGRVVAVVDIEVSMWSHDSSDLQLRPAARHPERWSSLRIRRYFALAHRAADETARRLAQRALTPREARACDPTCGPRVRADPVGSRR
jgi:hypothetical protein